MPTSKMAGVFPILVTPYDARSRIDVDSLRSLIEFNLAAGVHGLGVALGSEITALSESERALVTRVVVAQVAGRVPVVINTGGPVTELAVLYTQMAAENGADAIMLRPPTFLPAGPDQIVAYYQAVAASTPLPIFIQETPDAPVSGALARRIADSCAGVRYIKVESGPPPLKVGQAVAESAGRLAVFGGAGGTFFIEELRRGAVGTMPGCSQPAAFVAVWDAWQRGDEAAARTIMRGQIWPANQLATQAPGAFYHVHKEILVQRGVIATALVRGPVPPLDEVTRRELQQLIGELFAAGH